MRLLTLTGRFDSKHPNLIPRKRVRGSIEETCAIVLRDFGLVCPQDLCLEKLCRCLETVKTHLDMAVDNLLWLTLPEQGSWTAWSPDAPSKLIPSVTMSW